MVIIGRYFSPFTRRVAVYLRLLEIPYEIEPLTAWHNLDEVRRTNPVGRVPSLILDDGEVLFDSSAIVDYLDEVAGPERALTPQAGAERRDVVRLTAAAMGILEKAAAARYELVMRPEEKVHQPWLEHNLGQIRSGLAWLDSQAKGPWFTGERMTQADVTSVVMYEFLGLFDASLVPEGRWPGLEATVHRARDIPAFAETYPRA